MKCFVCGRKPKVFRCPQVEDVRKLWLDFCGIKNQLVNVRLCSIHFEDKYFKENAKRARLLRNAVPSLNPPRNRSLSCDKFKGKMLRRRQICALCGNVDKAISYFSFPQNEERRKQWMDICRMPEITTTRKLCEKHFKEEDIVKSVDPDSRTKLRYNAIPTHNIRHVIPSSDKIAQHSVIKVPSKKNTNSGRRKIIDPAQLVHCHMPPKGSKNIAVSVTIPPSYKNTYAGRCKVIDPAKLIHSHLPAKGGKNGQSSANVSPDVRSEDTNPVQVVQCFLPAKGDKNGQSSMTVVPPNDANISVGQKVVIKYVTQEYINELIRSNKEHLSRIKQLEDENKALKHKLSTIQALTQTNTTNTTKVTTLNNNKESSTIPVLSQINPMTMMKVTTLNNNKESLTKPALIQMNPMNMMKVTTLNNNKELSTKPALIQINPMNMMKVTTLNNNKVLSKTPALIQINPMTMMKVTTLNNNKESLTKPALRQIMPMNMMKVTTLNNNKELSTKPALIQINPTNKMKVTTLNNNKEKTNHPES
ncbi:uncharacterized protein LOC135849872 [Planococcus citri]|uniref:uncharacterized protein LOC135849872 n=1 Tax=Planococcus citri TaxID=170843 RepID=UPI0031F76EAC